MKRSTARWTTAIAAAALIGVPAVGWSQTPPAASQPPAAQQPADAKAGSPAEHIRQAEAALNDIPASTLPARAKSRVGELKRHLNALEKSAAAGPASGADAAKPESKGKNAWANDVAAIDKILTELVPTGGASSAPPAATGTTGAAPKSAPLTIDDTTKAKLMEVRQHVTAFATSMSGAGSSGPAPSSEPSPEPAAAAAAQAPAATPAPTAESTPPASTPPASASASPSASSQTAPSAQSAAPAAAQPAEQSQAQAPTAPAASSQDEEAAKRHLTAARDSLAQLTQLPAAAQLTGDARTQVSQLISNFNELITAKADWKASYDKVSGNVTALIGAESAAPEAAAAAPAAAAPAGTPGAVGTSGTTATALDPAIKGKLVEFRTHLMAFEKAAGEAASGASSPSSAMPSSAPSGTPAASPSASSPSSSSASADPDPAPRANPPGQSPAQPSSAGQASQGSPMSHIQAIEAMLVGSGSKLTLEPAQVEQIRMHLAELRKSIDKE